MNMEQMTNIATVEIMAIKRDTRKMTQATTEIRNMKKQTTEKKQQGTSNENENYQGTYNAKIFIKVNDQEAE